MGLSPFSSNPSTSPQAPEPVPTKFTILSTKAIRGWTVAEVHYPGCTTYSGMKLLVFDVPPNKVRDQTLLDPHFLESKDRLSPVARFEPTKRGRELAHLICTERTIWG